MQGGFRGIGLLGRQRGIETVAKGQPWRRASRTVGAISADCAYDISHAVQNKPGVVAARLSWGDTLHNSLRLDSAPWSDAVICIESAGRSNSTDCNRPYSSGNQLCTRG
jgi:hypothetical protein